MSFGSWIIKRWRLLVCSGLVAVGTLEFLTYDASRALLYSSVPYDFGTVTAGESVDGKIRMRNASWFHSSSIGSISATCGCQSVTVGKAILAPGEETDLKIVFTPSLTARGPKNERILMQWKLPLGSAKTAIFYTRANIGPTVFVTPQLVYLGDVMGGASAESTVLLNRKEAGSLQESDYLLSEEAEGMGLVTKGVQVKDPFSIEFILTFDLSKRKGGIFNGKANFRSTHEAGRKMPGFSFAGYLDRGIEISPRSLYLGRVGTERREMKIAARSEDGSKLIVKGIEVSDNLGSLPIDLSRCVTQTSPSEAYMVFSILPAAKFGAIEGEIDFRFQLGGNDVEYRVPVLGNRQ